MLTTATLLLLASLRRTERGRKLLSRVVAFGRRLVPVPAAVAALLVS